MNHRGEPDSKAANEAPGATIATETLKKKDGRSKKKDNLELKC